MSDHTSNSQQMKRCSKGDNCIHPNGPWLPATEEYFYRSKRDGFSYYCKECRKKTSREWGDKNPERKREWYQRWAKNNPEKVRENRSRYYRRHRGKILARHHRYYRRNADQIKSNAKQWAENNKNKRREISKRWVVNNPEKREKSQRRYNISKKGRASSERRRSRKLNAFGSHTSDDISRIYQKQKGHCLYCGCDLNDRYHIDHFIPLSTTGVNSHDNIVLSCEFCNLSKGGKLPWDWDRWNGSFPVEWKGRLL